MNMKAAYCNECPKLVRQKEKTNQRILEETEEQKSLIAMTEKNNTKLFDHI